MRIVFVTFIIHMILEVRINSWRLNLLWTSSLRILAASIIFLRSFSVDTKFPGFRHYTIVEIETGILLSFKNNIVFHAISIYNIILLAEMKIKKQWMLKNCSLSLKLTRPFQKIRQHFIIIWNRNVKYANRNKFHLKKKT